MKKSFLIMLAFLGVTIQTCRDEESVTLGKIQFTFHASSLNPGGRVKSSLPDGSLLFVSIERSNGEVLYAMKELALLKFGEQYMSEPLALPHGEYFITDLIITDASHTVIYATPKNDSPLATLVEHPLPISFSVNESDVTDLSVEVIATDAHLPAEFGYASFGILVVPTEVFQLAVFIPNEQSFILTSAQAFILHDEDTLYRASLPAATSSIAFATSPDEFYTLVLIKESYGKYSRTFRVNDLKDELNGTPLSVMLQPALTFTALANRTDHPQSRLFELRLDINPSAAESVTIDWGDGTIEEYHTGTSLQSHQYAAKGPYFVSVYGELQAIEEFSVYYCCNDIGEISLRFVPELKRLAMVLCKTPSTIDVSHNLKLESIELSESSVVSLDVSNNIHLKYFDIAFNPNFSTESLTEIIHDLYQHAVTHNNTNGYFTFFSGQGGMIGPPSDTALEELRILRDDYHWTLNPDF